MMNTLPFATPAPELVLLPDKSVKVVKEPTESFKKYEITYGFNSSDDKYNHKKYITRVITNDIEKYISEGNTQYITVFQFHEVSKRRADYLCDKGYSFEFVRYKN